MNWITLLLDHLLVQVSYKLGTLWGYCFFVSNGLFYTW